MYSLRTHLAVLCAAAALMGCGSSDDSKTSAGVAPTDNGADGADAGGADAGPTMVTVRGTFADNGAGVADATIEVVGASPANTTTTSATGAWSLTILSSQPLFFHASKVGYRTVQVGLQVPSTGVSDLALDVVPEDLPRQLFMSTGITEDTSAGILAVSYIQTSGARTLPGGFGAILSAGGGTRVALGNGASTVRYTTVGGDRQELIIVNVAVGTTSVSVTAPAGFA